MKTSNALSRHLSARTILYRLPLLLIFCAASAAAADEFRINAGGAEFTNLTGELFVADKAFSVGDFGFVGGSTRTFSGDVTGTEDDALFSGMRGRAAFEYIFDAIANGDYDITLYFTDPTATSSNQQLFDVSVEGSLVLDGLDIFASSGGQLAAHTESFTATVTDGQLNIEFAAAVGPRAMISAISVVSVGSPPMEPDIGVTPLVEDFGDVEIGNSSEVTIVVSNNGPALLSVRGLMMTNADFVIVSPAVPFTIEPNAPPVDVTVSFSPTTPGSSLGDIDIFSNDPDENIVVVSLSGNGVVSDTGMQFHIDIAGDGFTNSAGDLFVADRAFSAGDFGFVGGTSRIFVGDVAGTDDDELFLGLRGRTPFEYIFDAVPNGDYDITLYMTNPLATTTGQHLFDVIVEGNVVIDDLDVFASSGGQLSALIESFTTEVTDGQLNIEITGGGRVSAISVVSEGGAPPPPPPSGEYKFVDVAEAAGVTDADREHFGNAWFDYNNDGLYDLYAANGLGAHPLEVISFNRLYVNNGDGTFTNITADVGAEDPWVAMRNVAADFDNDGDQDIYSHNFIQSTLYRLDDFVYVDANEQTNAGVALAKGTGASWGDYDNDGHVDIALTAFPGINVLLHNNGDGTFTNLQQEAQLPLAASAMGNAFGDYDNDGDLDLAAAAVTRNDLSVLFRNNGDGTFTDVTVAANIVLEPGSSNAPVTWGDYDNDGYLDLFISEVLLGSEKVVPARMYLFHNNQDGTFTDVTVAAGLLSPPPDANEFWDAGFADYDHDGDLDLYVAGGGANQFWRNNGDGTFVDVAPSLGVDLPGRYVGVAWADYDNDHDLDMYVMRHGGANSLFQNTGGSNNWLYIDLTGTVSNRDGIGTRVTITIGGEIQIREARAGRGFFTQDSKTLEFGLGTAAIVDSVTIQWPSGIVTELASVPANQVLSIVESAP